MTIKASLSLESNTQMNQISLHYNAIKPSLGISFAKIMRSELEETSLLIDFLNTRQYTLRHFNCRKTYLKVTLILFVFSFTKDHFGIILDNRDISFWCLSTPMNFLFYL